MAAPVRRRWRPALRWASRRAAEPIGVSRNPRSRSYDLREPAAGCAERCRLQCGQHSIDRAAARGSEVAMGLYSGQLLCASGRQGPPVLPATARTASSGISPASASPDRARCGTSRIMASPLRRLVRLAVNYCSSALGQLVRCLRPFRLDASSGGRHAGRLPREHLMLLPFTATPFGDDVERGAERRTCPTLEVAQQRLANDIDRDAVLQGDRRDHGGNPWRRRRCRLPRGRCRGRSRPPGRCRGNRRSLRRSCAGRTETRRSCWRAGWEVAHGRSFRGLRQTVARDLVAPNRPPGTGLRPYNSRKGPANSRSMRRRTSSGLALCSPTGASTT